MVIRRTLSRLVGMALLVAAIGCSAASPAEVAPTPNIEATVEARLAQERAVDVTVEARLKEEKAPEAQPTSTPVPQSTDRITPTETSTPVHSETATIPENVESLHDLGTSTLTSAKELTETYEASPSDANDMYIGKSLSIHGRIDSFSRTERHVDMKFEKIGDTLNIVCQVADDYSLQYLEIGHFVVVNGIMAEFLRFGDIVLEDCTVPSPSQMAENSHWRGTYLKARSAYDAALEELNRAIDLKPDYLEAYHQLVSTYRAMDYQGAAFYQAERAAELYPLDAKFHLILGEIALYSYEDTRDDKERYCRDVDCPLEGYKRAEQEFSHAFALDSDFLEALDGLGTTYMWLAWHFDCHKNALTCEHGRPDTRVANEYYYKAIDSYTELIDVSVADGSGQVDEWLFPPPPRDQNTQYSPKAIGLIRRSNIYENLGQIDNAKRDRSIACSIDKTLWACRSAP